MQQVNSWLKIKHLNKLKKNKPYTKCFWFQEKEIFSSSSKTYHEKSTMLKVHKNEKQQATKKQKENKQQTRLRAATAARHKAGTDAPTRRRQNWFPGKTLLQCISNDKTGYHTRKYQSSSITTTVWAKQGTLQRHLTKPFYKRHQWPPMFLSCDLRVPFGNLKEDSHTWTKISIQEHSGIHFMVLKTESIDKYSAFEKRLRKQ